MSCDVCIASWIIYGNTLWWRHNERDCVQITSLTIVYSIISGADQRKHQSSASLVFVRGIHRRPVNSPHKGPIARKMFPFDDVIMICLMGQYNCYHSCPIRVVRSSLCNMPVNTNYLRRCVYLRSTSRIRICAVVQWKNADYNVDNSNQAERRFEYITLSSASFW